MSGTRHQNGYVFRSGRYWYLRYYDTVLTDSGETHRVQNCKQLVVAEGAFRSKKSAQRLAEEYLKPFNDGTHRPEGTMSLKRFVENEYLPFIQRQKRPSTYCGYRKMWSRYLAGRSEMALRDFRTLDCERLLGEIAEVYNVSTTTLRHVKNMLSGIFRYATRIGILNVPNPVRDACAPKGNASNETYAYSLEEITRMLSVLPEHVVPVVAAAAFTGARKGELRGFLWENYGDQQIRITQSVWNRHITAPKTIRSTAPVPVIGALARILDRYHQSIGNPVTGFMFCGHRGQPLDLDMIARKIIKPTLEKAGLKWVGWHGFRRGLATNLYRLGVSDKTIQAILRHANVSTTMNLYVKAVGSDAVAAMQALDRVLCNDYATDPALDRFTAAVQ